MDNTCAVVIHKYTVTQPHNSYQISSEFGQLIQ